ncbi:MAG TPA: phosphatidylglycerophosphatase A [Burkholderiaceae bacterium]|nr:phosphatidylglycerophosphatase A [Burkholderiaceae bacterium]
MADERISDAHILRDDAPVPGARRPGARFLLRHPAHWFALGFGSGLAPWAPGTVGTLWAWVSFLVFDPWLGAAGWGLVIAASLALGVWACARTAEHLALVDPGVIVWDEVVAFWIVLWLVTPAGWLAQALAFALFRFFDVVKPGPVRWVDRRFKTAHGLWQGVGILADDLAAALGTLLVIALWRFAFP